MRQINEYYNFMNEINVNLASLDLNLITALSALLDRRSVTEAADAVGRTQSAMSHSLSRLREHFRDPILVRDGREMRLTPFAENLHPRVMAAAEAAKQMFTASFEFDPATTTRRIRIAAPDLCSSLFTSLIANLGERAPLASIEFVQSSTARDAVLSSEADIGLGFGHAKSDANLVLHSIAPLDWCTFAPKAHPFCKACSATLLMQERDIAGG